MALSKAAVDTVVAGDASRFRDPMRAQHYLGAVPGMDETVRHVAHHRGRWLALTVFSAPTLKCGARNRDIIETDNDGWRSGTCTREVTATRPSAAPFPAGKACRRQGRHRTPARGQDSAPIDSRTAEYEYIVRHDDAGSGSLEEITEQFGECCLFEIARKLNIIELYRATSPGLSGFDQGS